MLVSWNWLKEYVRLDMSVEVLTDRLMMAGLNLEEFQDLDETGDIQIDLEVTSNRPDCLGHIGIARETSVLFQRPLTLPPALVHPIAERTEAVTSVTIETPEVCPRYVARVIRNVKIGPSPKWLRDRLKTVGQPSINNVVDVTNYVLFECGQPLHAFDFNKLQGKRIIVRQARPGEKLEAINHETYTLTPEMCVIADDSGPVALGGVMGGLSTEISEQTADVLIEAAEFAPRSIRATARKLALHSPSSYRFERGIDSTQLDWASRRCCELILKTGGGELLSDPIIAGIGVPAAKPVIRLRLSQLPRILGIHVPTETVERILTSLGLDRVAESSVENHQEEISTWQPPHWRRDLEREIDLIEEIARIHGYEQIPEDKPVPLTVSTTTRQDKVRSRISEILVGAGFFEAVTVSFVDAESSRIGQPWGPIAPLSVDHSTRVKENLLRQSLVPSLLQGRRHNERHGNFDGRLFEFAKVFLHAKADRTDPLAEPEMLACVTEQSFGDLKGLIESLVAALNPGVVLTARPCDWTLFESGRGAELLLNGKQFGWIGEVSLSVRNDLGLRDPVSAAELRVGLLFEIANLAPEHRELPKYPASERDLNFVLDEQIPWEELSSVVRSAAGVNLESISFGGQYRGQQIPANKKSYVARLSYRSREGTLTNDEVEAAQQLVISACQTKLGATLR